MPIQIYYILITDIIKYKLDMVNLKKLMHEHYQNVLEALKVLMVVVYQSYISKQYDHENQLPKKYIN